MLSSLLLAVTIVAHDPGYNTSLANHIRRWLKSEDVAATVVTPAQMSAALAKEKMAFLVGFGAPTAGEMKTLKSFRARGGKLCVFHSGSPELASLMGVKPLGFAQARYPGVWSRMDFANAGMEGTPGSILQTSSVLTRVAPVKGKGRVIAWWKDRQGRDTGDAAWIATTGGWWMSHVLSADGDEALKAQLLAAMVNAAQPGAWSFKRHLAKQSEVSRQTAAFASKQVPRAGEIHAVWDHSGCGLYPGNWPKTFKLLKESHVTDLFVNVAGAGFAHYPSTILPRSKTFDQEGDQLAKCLAAAKGTGIRVHAWILCFTGTRSTPERLEIFRKKGWRLKTASGKLTEYLNPGNAQVRAYILSAVDEMQTMYPALNGIHLDFVRWYEQSAKPKDAAETIEKFVAAARYRVKRPRWLTTAVLGKYPNCVGSVGQDWTSWLNANLVDYVVPMDYTEDLATFSGYVAQHAAIRRNAARTIAGIGVTANESRLTARKVIEQALVARKANLAGVSLFDLDVNLEKEILPYLKMGVW